MSQTTLGNVVWALMACYRQQHGLELPQKGFDTLYELARQYHLKKYLTKSQVNLAYRMLPDAAFECLQIDSLPLDYRGQDPPKQIQREIEIQNGHLVVPSSALEGKRPLFLEMFKETPTLPGRDCTKVPLSWVSIDNLQDMGLTIPERVRAWRDSFLRGELPKLDYSGLERPLMPHQPYAVECITAQGGRCLLADQMGLGKTMEAIAWLCVHREALPAVVVCPSMLKINWKREFEMVFGKGMLNIQIIDGRPDSKKVPECDVLILNYDIIGHTSIPKKKASYPYPTHVATKKGRQVLVRTGWGRFLSSAKRFKTVIFDEAHYIKNSEASRTQACLGFAKTCRHILWLSGTPIEQRPIELWTAINALAPGMFSSKQEFGIAFCEGKKDRYGRWDFGGSGFPAALNDWLLRTIMVRRRKQDLLKDLPEKTKCVTVMPMSKAGAAEYGRAEKDFRKWYKGIKGSEAAMRAAKAEHLAKIISLKQLSWDAKKDAVFEWLETFFESDEKLVIFHEYKKTGADVAAFLKESKIKFVQIDGSTAQKNRQPSVDAFQNDPSVQVFLGQIVACGTGLTLTAASNSVTLDYMWSPAKHAQAEDRLWRIGQKNAVFAHYLPAADSVEESILSILDKKASVVGQVLDGEKEEDSGALSLLTKLILSRED